MMVDRKGRSHGLCYAVTQPSPALISGEEDVRSRMWFLCTEPGEGNGITSKAVPEGLMPPWCQELCSTEEDLQFYLCSMSREADI